MNEQNISQAKFLIKELLAILKLLDANDYDDELKQLIEDLSTTIFA